MPARPRDKFDFSPFSQPFFFLTRETKRAGTPRAGGTSKNTSRRNMKPEVTSGKGPDAPASGTTDKI